MAPKKNSKPNACETKKIFGIADGFHERCREKISKQIPEIARILEYLRIA
jgi:hypothetical protein